MPLPIYLDHNATTPVDPGAVEAMRPYLGEHFGNPSSTHAYGRPAQEAVELARARVAGLLGCGAAEVVFTSGGTESNNMALVGAALAGRGRRDHVITTCVEHPSVLASCRLLERRWGCRVTYLPVDAAGRVDPAEVAGRVTARTLLVSVMHANNETGVLQPVAEIAAAIQGRGVLLHTDAAQSIGKVPVDVRALGADLLTVAGHKVYAPKGVGALAVRRGVELEPVLVGAGQEHGVRPGTENVAGVAALGAACVRAGERLAADGPRLAALRDRLWCALEADGWLLNGAGAERLPNTLNASLPGADGEEILRRVPEVAASTGSACHSGRTEPSAVLLAMGLSPARALGAVRLSLGRGTTAEEVERAAAALIAAGRAALGRG